MLDWPINRTWPRRPALNSCQSPTSKRSAIMQTYTPAEVCAKLYLKAPLAGEAWLAYFQRMPSPESVAEHLTKIFPLIDHRLTEPARLAILEPAIQWAKSSPPAEREIYL